MVRQRLNGSSATHSEVKRTWMPNGSSPCRGPAALGRFRDPVDVVLLRAQPRATTGFAAPPVMGILMGLGAAAYCPVLSTITQLPQHLPCLSLACMSRTLRVRSSVVEHLTFNQGVDGSIPSGLTNVLK